MNRITRDTERIRHLIQEIFTTAILQVIILTVGERCSSLRWIGA